MTHEYFTTVEGHKLYCTIWNKVKNPRAVVLVICGIDDTIERYQEFAEYLNQHGYIVFGACNNIENNQYAFDKSVNLHTQIIKYLKYRFDLRVLIFGHSWGAFVAQKLLMLPGLCTAGVCMSGAGKYSDGMLNTLRTISWIGKTVFGPDASARLIEKTFPMRGKNKQIKYLNYGFYYSLFRNLEEMKYENECKTPLLIISGGQDAFTMRGRLARHLYNAYQGYNTESLTVIIYPDADNDLMSEISFGDMKKDVLEFFNSSIFRY